MRDSPYSALPLLVFLSILELISGYFLGSIEERLLSEPAFLILVPVIIAIGGNLGSLLSSRLSTFLHLGVLNPRDIKVNILAIFGLSVTLFSLVAIITFFISILQGGDLSFAQIFYISIGTGAVLTVLSVTISLTFTYISKYLGLDPDNIVIPIVTVICDVFGILAFVSILYII